MANETEQSDVKTESENAGKPAARQTTQTTQETAPPVTSDEPRFTAAGWAERARATFKASPHALAGALYGQDAADFTEDEVRDLLDKFSVREGI